MGKARSSSSSSSTVMDMPAITGERRSYVSVRTEYKTFADTALEIHDRETARTKTSRALSECGLGYRVSRKGAKRSLCKSAAYNTHSRKKSKK